MQDGLTLEEPPHQRSANWRAAVFPSPGPLRRIVEATSRSPGPSEASKSLGAAPSARPAELGARP
eukprot:15364905-Alexandrium_andersonii.AAC.1